MRKTVLIVLAIVMLISFVGCEGSIDSSEAKQTINDFFGYVKAGDYDLAATLLHPDRPAPLSDFFIPFENEYGLDYSNGIEIKKTISTSSAVYDNSVGGSIYRKHLLLEISGREIESEIEIVNNDNGYGIYNFYMKEKE